MNERSPEDRAGDFKEVVAGYTPEEALLEASRCLQCRDARCVAGCPVGINIRDFIGAIVRKDFAQACAIIWEKNNFPSICGRVCPAENQCRKACVLTKKGAAFASLEAININFLERFAGDRALSSRPSRVSVSDEDLSRFRVAVVGSGPAGLCCAGELARRGVRVVVFEGLHKPGGVLRYGIPSFRLPQDVVDREISALEDLGVVFRLNTLVGKTLTIEDLFRDGFSSVFLGLGAGTPSFLGIPGESLGNVYSANEFLTRVNLMGAHLFPEYHTPVNVGRRIVVIGGGNTAMDAARVALRLQRGNGISVDVTVLYRRTMEEMPARRLEIEHARQEGVRFEFLTSPTRFLGGTDGSLQSLECLRCRLGEPDARGRRRPQEIPGSVFVLDFDQAIVAIGLTANQVLVRATPGLEVNSNLDITVDPHTMRTSLQGVYAGGDVVGGEGTVIEAMGMAKKAAGSILKCLESLP